jgi:hypothetical protein
VDLCKYILNLINLVKFSVTAVPGFDVNAVVVVSKEVIEKSKIHWGFTVILQDD